MIAEKLATGDWSSHAGKSESLFVNASTWGLMLTGGILELDPSIKTDTAGWMRKLTRKAGEPLVRLAVRRAMRIIGGEFVVGRSIEEALTRSAREADVALCSFDMLGEGARTQQDALRYLASYEHAIDVIGAAAGGRPAHEASSMSIKLSALESRYSLLQHERVMRRLVPVVTALVRRAAALGIQLTLDAEEADRLDLSLDVIEALASDPATRDWPGLGLAVQAYGKRALDVIDWVAATARAHGRRMTVRLVKGAYWDSEIKRAQERGLDAYPVYTRKVTTDVSYLACVGRLFSHADVIYPQFATHNAHSIASVLELAPAGADYEFQRLHGMGRLLYAEAERQIANFPRVRIYAPVGEHKDLLAYLVRRLLENGANTSFVNRFMDEEVPVAEIVRDPISELERLESYAHPRLPLPAALYADRRNSRGIDLGNPPELEALRKEISTRRALKPMAGPIINGVALPGSVHAVMNPADRREQVGSTRDATPQEIEAAFDSAAQAQAAWNFQGGEARAACLDRTSDLLEASRADFHELLVREAGKTIGDAIAEVREAVDFCRYYAARTRSQFSMPSRLEGPTGEANELSLHGRGVFACISPWNFPLAIFNGPGDCRVGGGQYRRGQAGGADAADRRAIHPVAASGRSTAAGSASRAGARAAIRRSCICPCRPGGSGHDRLDGDRADDQPQFGGAQRFDRAVDSGNRRTECNDRRLDSASGTSGRRCREFRVHERRATLLRAALAVLAGRDSRSGGGDDRRCDGRTRHRRSCGSEHGLGTGDHRRGGRGLDAARVAHARGGTHRQGVSARPGSRERQLLCAASDRAAQRGAAHARGIWAHPACGALSVRRHTRGAACDSCHSLRLDLGVQTRLESFWRQVFEQTAVGNTYVNRNMIGAVVGAQPFGGTGLSGTGPKAGGPHYLARFANERTLTVNTTATGGNAALLNLGN